MANIASQKKRNARSLRERLENRRRTSQVKTWFRRLEDAVDAKDDSRADEEFRALVSRIDRAVKTGALHRNTGARRKARAAKLRSRISA
jgi:small subunit ribosomal protein S20